MNQRQQISSEENVQTQINATVDLFSHRFGPFDDTQKAEATKLLNRLLKSIDFPQLVESQQNRRASRARYNERQSK